MNAFDASPDLEAAQLAAGHAPPTPPHEDALDDIYGSAPALLAHQEILSDLPSRQRALDTDAYREGLANSKGQTVQSGFDEGYSLGANMGLKIGYILGLLQGLAAAWKAQDAREYQRVHETTKRAQAELAIEELLGQKWVDDEGIWLWGVTGSEADPTLREVAEQHPVVQKWTQNVETMASNYGVDLKAVEKHQAPTSEGQS